MHPECIRRNILEIASSRGWLIKKNAPSLRNRASPTGLFLRLDIMKNPKFSQLVFDNKAIPKSFAVTAKAEGGTRIDLFDVIDDYCGISATAFVSALNEIQAGDISLHINSPGGDVFSARAMVAAIAAHPSTVTAYIDGLAASAASYVAVACDKVVMQKGSMLMVHRASSIVWGNSADLLEMAGLLDKIDATIASDYARKTGSPEPEMMALMTAETWLTADECLAMGFADAVVENEKGKAKTSNTWNLAAYTNAPAAIAEPEPIPEPTPEPTPDPLTATRERSIALLNRI